MNQVIKEMGQEVIRQENVDEPGKRTRLIGCRDVVHVLGDCLGTDSVRSIKFDDSLNDSDPMKEEATVQIEAFKKMSNLRFIKLDDSKLECSSSSNDDMSACFSFKHLKYLEWNEFPCKSLDNIDMGNVVVIKLSRSELEKLWDGVKNFKKLKILDVRYSHSLIKTGNFTSLENLEELNLHICENLEELDSSIGCLQKLVDLDLSDCTRLKRIPDLPPSIQELKADRCINLVNLPSNCSELQFLTNLRLDNCCKLGSEGFTQVTRLRNLQKLGMRKCNISQVSSGIGNLVSLEHLYLSYNTFSSLPESFSNLSKLEGLHINNCSELQLLPPLPSQLKALYINGCSQLQSLPPFPSQLEYINANDCWSLNVIPFDSMQKAYTFHSKMFKESLMNTKGLYIGLSGKELPEWCTYRNRGDVLSFEAPIRFDSKICGLILCASCPSSTNSFYWAFSTIHNKSKEKSHCVEPMDNVSNTMVVFYPLNDKTVVVEAGDTVQLQFKNYTSCGLRLVYEDDVVDSELALPS